MARGTYRIVVAERISPSAMQRLGAVGEVVELESHDRATLLAAARDCDALVVRTYAEVSAPVIQAAVRMKVIGRAGVGVENIDTVAAAAAGIVVVYSPAASTQAVAELTIGLMITLERRVSWAEQELRQGKFKETRSRLANRQLAEMTLGIIGYGRIGRRVSEIAHDAFAMHTLFNDIREVEYDESFAAAAGREEIYTQADVVSLHVPLTDLTRNLVDAAALGTMKATALLINTARGAVVDAETLAEALRDGQIAGAAVDVFDPEPLPLDHPLLGAPNCILTPHIGSRTRTSLAAMNDVVDDVIAVLQGRPPQCPYAQ